MFFQICFVSSTASQSSESYFQLSTELYMLRHFVQNNSSFFKKWKPKSIIYIVHLQGIWSRSWENAVWEHNDKWSNAKMRSRVRVQEAFEDLYQRNENSDAGSVQEMMNLSLAVSLLYFMDLKFDNFLPSS